MSELTVGVNSSETLWTVDAVPDPEFGFYTIGSEIVQVIAGFPGGDPGYAVGQTFPAKIRVIRGTNGTSAASHLSGAALTAANAFSGGGGGSLSVTDGTTTVAATTLSLPPGTVVDAGAGVASAGVIAQTSVTLTDAQIKHLPNLGIEIVPAPGATNIVVPLVVIFAKHFAAGAYTNDSGFCALYLTDNSGSQVSNLLIVPPAVSANNDVHVVGAGIQIPDQAGVFAGFLKSFAIPANSPLNVSAATDNGLDFTGGNAANSLKVTVLYSVISAAA